MDTTPVTTGNRRIRFEDDSDERPPGDDSRPGGFDDGQDRSKVSLAPTSKPQPTALQQKMLAMAGQDIDQFMKEVRDGAYYILLLSSPIVFLFYIVIVL